MSIFIKIISVFGGIVYILGHFEGFSTRVLSPDTNQKSQTSAAYTNSKFLNLLQKQNVHKVNVADYVTTTVLTALL